MDLVHLNDANFKDETKEGLVVVDFFATWCGPCKILGPIMEDVQKELSNVKIFKVDVDENEETARNFGVMSIPTIVVLKDGVEIDRHVGLMNRDSLVEWINQH
jgi:thioredoxin 1